MYFLIWSPIITDPCAEIKCGKNAICKVVYATGKAFCSCPYLMVGNPYEICGELYCNLGEKTVIKCPKNHGIYYISISPFFIYTVLSISEGEQGVETGKQIVVID